MRQAGHKLLSPTEALGPRDRTPERTRVPPHDVLAIRETAPLALGEKRAKRRVAERDGLVCAGLIAVGVSKVEAKNNNVPTSIISLRSVSVNSYPSIIG